MDRLSLDVIDHQLLELLDGHPGGLSLSELAWLFDRNMTRTIGRLLHMGVLERTPTGTFRTLGHHDRRG